MKELKDCKIGKNMYTMQVINEMLDLKPEPLPIYFISFKKGKPQYINLTKHVDGILGPSTCRDKRKHKLINQYAS